MIEDPPEVAFTFDPHWLLRYEPEQQRGDYVAKLTEEKRKWITTAYAQECQKERKKDIWIACVGAGVTVSDLVTNHFDKNGGNLLRKLNAGTAFEYELWIAVKEAGLDPNIIMLPPNAAQEFRGKTRAVEMFKHRCMTVDLPLCDADRIPEHLHGAYAALLQRLLADGNTTEKFLYVAAQTVGRDFGRLPNAPQVTDYLGGIYQAAASVEGIDQSANDLLYAWSPGQAGLPTSLGRLAQAWNRYQMHWYLVSEVADSL